jgi:heme-degrading monooxygenase HmoA
MAMYARVTTLETTPEQHDAGVRTVMDEYVPWVRDSTGFRGIVGLYDVENAHSIVITLWDDAESREASADAADRLSALSADVSGSRREQMRNYTVDYFELDGRDVK